MTAIPAPIRVSRKRCPLCALPSASTNNPLIGICAAAPPLSRSTFPTRNPSATIRLIDQACSPISPPSQIATRMPISTATTFSSASRMDARTVSSAISEAVIGAQIGEGESSNHSATAHDTPAETAIFNACHSTFRSIPSSSDSGRSRHDGRPVSACSRRSRRSRSVPRPAPSAVAGSGWSIWSILPH